MASFSKVAKLSDLKEGEVKGIIVGKEQIALYKLGDEVLATSDICTHEFCIISDNYFVEGEEVECTCHGSRFDLHTGVNTVPPAAAPLKTYKTKIENDEVFVEV